MVVEQKSGTKVNEAIEKSPVSWATSHQDNNFPYDSSRDALFSGEEWQASWAFVISCWYLI